ncbi:uncharacterized protein LOC136038468 isoform X2 [Artemia franciscana]|uniref:Uncharacterized protein n=1 Tax=Artemia franciscana TaxID=6661 RepID=A0AA88HVP7_ARTSF|nr:hypothetical protein QYM36_006674 [Artemia franciscana]
MNAYLILLVAVAPSVLSAAIAEAQDRDVIEISMPQKRAGPRRIGRKPNALLSEWPFDDGQLSPYSGYHSQYFLKAAKAIPRLGRRWDVSPRDELIRELSEIANQDSSEDLKAFEDSSVLEDPLNELLSRYYEIWLKRRRQNEINEIEM